MNHYSVKKRLDWIDQIKGLAILGIVLFHFFQNYPESISLVNFLDRSGAKVGFAAVDIFFVLSGFNIGYKIFSTQVQKQSNYAKNPAWFVWFNRRIARIYPTYWLAIAFSWLIYFVSSYQLKSISIRDFILIGLGVPGYERFKLINPGFWFVSVIIQAYLLIPLLLFLTDKKPIKILTVGIALGLINNLVCAIAGFYGNYSLYWFLLQNNFLGSYIFPVCLGVYWGLIYGKYQNFRQQDWQVAIAAFSLGILIQIISAVIGVYLPYKLGLDLLYIPLFVLICYFFCTQVIKRYLFFQKTLKILGTYSYQVYLIHQPLFFVLLPVLVSQIVLNVYLSLALAVLMTTIILVLYFWSFIKADLIFRNLIGKTYSKG